MPENRPIFKLSFRVLTLLLLVFLAACSTKKNKWTSRAYHNTTSKYNAWFNGNELIKEIELTLSDAHKDNFYKVIPVYRLGSLEDSKAIIPQSDKAIKKGSMVIAKHNMMIRGKQYNRYIDDAYMLVGKGLYYKREYYAALEMFTFVTRNVVKNRRRDAMQHQANLWQARAYMDIGMVSDARMALDRSLNDPTMPKEAKGDVYMALTDFYLRQNNYPKALEAVSEAVKFTKKKKTRARLMFIQAQLMQKTNELKGASDLYDKVAKMNPSYEMGFYCAINKARCYSSESGNSAAIRKLLADMLKDPKNIDLADQIYYVLGEIELKEERSDKAVDQFNLSLRANTNNAAQKGLSYLALAEIYFGDKEYRTAAAYYDSCMKSLPEDYPDYKKVENLRNALADLVKRYETIERYDSLLRMSNLDKASLDKKIDEIIAREEEARKKRLAEEEAARKKAEADQNSGGANSANGSFTGPGVTGNGQWYFVNPSAMGFGFTEFRKIWGERKLEDHWRRSNKQTVAPVIINEPDNPDKDPKTGEPKEAAKPKTREDSLAEARAALMKGLPSSPEMKKAYADSVREAFYALGMIYRERLDDYRKSAQTFEEFLKKYPTDPSEATVYYQLYRIYLKLGDTKQAEKYKGLLLSKFPDSEYAQIIKDPNFFAAGNKNRQEAELYYEETYRLYKAREYKTVLDRCRSAEIKYASNSLLPKFGLLKALAIGQMRDVAAFRTALSEVSKNYPGDTVDTKAKELLKSLDKAQGIGGKDSTELAKPSFKYKPDTLHYFVIAVEDRAMNLNELKTRLSNFHGKYFSTKGLQITSRLAGTNYQIIQVSGFDSKKAGFDYMQTMDGDEELFLDIDLDVMDMFIITPSNYQLLMKEANVEDYVRFFKQVYE